MNRAGAIDSASRRLLAAGIEEGRREARLLLAHCLGVKHRDLLAGEREPLAPTEIARFDALLARRLNREPVSQILGEWEFWGLPILVTADTLTPRPDSETLVQAVLERIADRRAPLCLLDLGTGTGCLLLALLHELPHARGQGVDISDAALAVARRNAARLGLADRAGFAVGDWATGLADGYDIVVSNPPYIPAAEIPDLMPEVGRFEPCLALDGGSDGLAAYRALAPQLAARLAAGGFGALEAGLGQVPAIGAILARAGLETAGVKRDLAGRERCVVFKKKK
jgi:release factor glutamine methyltransferase